MKVKNIKIGISSTQEVLGDFKKTCESLEKGETPKKKEGIYFENIDTLKSILTDKRLALLKAVKEKKPQSIYELAKILHRDIKNVNNDVSKLSELGFITLKKNKEERVKVAPSVDYDKILFEIFV